MKTSKNYNANKNYNINGNYNNENDKQSSIIKKVLLIIALILLIVALQFGISKYILKSNQTHNLYFYEYRIQLSEIVLSTENYTGEEVTVEITTQKPGLSIQYQLGDSGEWIDYVGPFSVDENVKINTRLASEPDNFIGPITSKEIKNIAVAKIGDEYFKTLAAAIDACAENAGDSKTVIEMLTNVEENVVIPEGKNIVLDLCGATIKNKATNENGTQNTNPTIIIEGKLNLIDSAKNEDGTLQGEGKVTSTTAEAIKVLGNGNFVLGTNESGTGAENEISITNPVVEGNTYGITVEENATFEFYDGKVSGKINAINGNVAATPEYYEVVANKENDYEVAILSQAATIAFDKNADESANITLEYETATKVIGQPIESLPTAQREGYVFVGWFTAKENGEQITAETIVEGTTTYYAIWEAYTYTIEYNANGGSGTTQETNAKYDEEITVPDNTFTAPDGYTFKEWNTNADGTGTTYNPGDKAINLTNEQSAIITLYAIWEDTISPSKTAPTGTGTTNTITVNCNQTDAGSGIDETTIQYAIFNKDTNADGKPDAWSEWQNSNIFENLSTNTEYEVKTQVTDKNGNGPVESEIGKISTSKIENGSIEVRKENAQGEIIEPETSEENKENQVNSNIYVDITPSTSGITTVTVKTPDGQTTTYTEDTTITTQTGMYEITVETTDGTNTVTDTYYVFVDKTAPTAQPTTSKTTNTITVNANAQDSDSGIADVTYTIKKGDEIVETNKIGEFAGLEDNTEYTVEITITDKAGNTTTKIENVKTEELVPGSIAFTETTSGETITPANTSGEAIVWVNENLNTVLTQGSTGTTTYEITAPDGTKTTYEQDAQIVAIEGNYVVTLRTTDGTNTKTVEYYFSVDKTVPTVTINPNEKDYTLQVGESSLNLETTISVVENESGLAITKYAISTSNTEKPQDSEFKDFVAGSQITENLSGGEYYVWVMVQDNAGNIAKTESLDAIVSGKFNIGYTVEYNLNGGTGDFASFRKPHGQNVGLSAEKPVRDRYIFKGWSEFADTSEINYVVGGTYTKNESKVLYAVWGEVVASTTIGEEVTLYESVQEAIDAAGTNKGAVVTLLKDEIAENVTVAAGQNIVLDVNGKTMINATATYTINNLGELTIIGEGTINGNSTSATIKSNTTGKTIIDGDCLINSENHQSISNNNIVIINKGRIVSEAAEAVCIYSESSIEVNGGSLQGINYAISNVNGNVTVSAGVLEGGTFGIYNKGNTLVTGGIIKGNFAIHNTKGYYLKVTGGEIISEKYMQNDGILEIIGGKVYGKTFAIDMPVDTAVLTIGTNEENPLVDITSPIIIGDNYGIRNVNNYTVNFYDGIIMGPEGKTIRGTVTDIPTGYRIVNGTQTIENTTYETAYLDNTYYVTFNENCENAQTTTKDIKYGTVIGELPTPTRENYIFDGWYTAQTDGEKITKETIITADTTFYAHWLEVVASTTIGDVTTNYASVQNAINAAGTNAGATVTLLKDEIAESVTVAAGQDIVIDLNGKTWANIKAQTITNNGKLTLKGDGKVTSSSTYTVYNNGTFEKYGNGTIEIESGQYALRNASIANLYEGSIISENIGIENKEGGKVLVDGIKIEASTIGIRNYSNFSTLSEPAVYIATGEIKSEENNAIHNLGTGLVYITDGKIISNNAPAIANFSEGLIYTSGGEIISENNHAISNSKGVINLIGGTIKATKTYAIVLTDAEGTLTIGIDEENPEVSITSPKIISGSSGVYNQANATFNFYDGIIMGPTERTIIGEVTDIPYGYYIENGLQTIDGVEYETSYLSAKNYEITQGATLADVVQVGDFVNYDASSNGVKTFTSSDCLAGTSISDTISTANSFYSSAPAQCPAQWRVLSVDKETGLVELMAVDPTTQTVTLTGGDGFVNAETVLNNIGAIYGSGKGATGGRSINIEDVEQYSSYDKTTYTNGNYKYGDTITYTGGKFYKEIKDENGNVTGYETTTTAASSSSPVTMTETYYYYTASSYFSNLTIYNMIFKNSTSTSSNKSAYWLASRCVYLNSSTCDFIVHNVGGGSVYGNNVYHSGGSAYSPAFRVVPVVTLQTNIKTTGKDANGAWQLSFEETTSEVNYSATLQSAIEKASAGSTIKVLNGIEETKAPTVPADKGLVLELNGKTTTLNGVSLTNNGGLTITGEGKLTSANADTIVNSGRLKKSGNGTIENTGATNVVINNAGMVNVLEGTVTGGSKAINTTSGIVTLGANDGTVSTNNPTINGTDTGVSVEGGKFNFYDGAVKGASGKSIVGEVSDVATGYAVVNMVADGVETSYLKQQYVITYDSNGEETPPVTQYKIHDENITLSSEILYRDYYVFKGWATVQNATTPEYLPGATYTANASATLYAVWVDAIASTKVGEKVTFYDTVQGAIDAAGTNAGATVTLLKDEIAESITVAADQDILLNLNGKKLANSGAQTITNNGTLTLNGEGTVTSSNQYTIKNYGTFEKYGNSTIEYAGTVYYALRNAGTANLYEGTITSSRIGVENKEGGKVLVDGITIQSNKEALRNYIANTASETLSNPSVIIKSGLIESNSTNAIYCSKNRVTDIQGGIIRGTIGIQVVYNAILNVSNATIEGSDTGISNYNNGQIFINEGNTIIGNNLYGITNDRDGIVTVTGGTIKGKAYGIVGQGTEELVGTIIITGGTINGKTAGVSQAKEDTLIIGTDDGVVDIEKPVIISGTQGVSNIKGGTFEFYDGIINGPDGYSITGTVTKIPDGYCIENGTQTIDGTTYETAYLATKNYEITQGATLADVVQVGDYVNYDANSNGEKTFTSTNCLAGSSISGTISTANSFSSSAPAQWRVLSVDKQAGVVELMAVNPTAQTVTLSGGDGFVNAETVLNNIGSIYGSGKGATGGRSINGEDALQYLSFDPTEFQSGFASSPGYYGTREYTSGNFYKEIKNDEGKIIGYESTTTSASSSPVTMTETYYVMDGTLNYSLNKVARLMIYHEPSYWLNDYCIRLDNDYVRYSLRFIGFGSNGVKLYDSNGSVYTGTYPVMPVVSLQTNIQTTGKDANGVWQLSFEETTSNSNYSATLQSAIEKASAGSTIKVLNGIEETTAPTVPAEKGLVLDLNGKTTTLNGVSLTNNGGLTITGEGKLTSANADTIVNSGRLKKSGNGTIENTGATNVVINNAGMVNVLEGTVTGGSKAINTTSGIVALGANDGTVSTNNLTIDGADTGVSVGGGKFNFYDGAVKGASGKSIIGTVSDVATGHAVVKVAADGIETSYLKQQYVITYDSNGEETPPSRQYKIHDENITLASEILYRDYYVFKGWATTQDATTPEYLPGATYTANASATLYAVWVDAAASTTVGESTTFYETVQGAIDAAGTNKGATVTLLKDEIIESTIISAEQDIVLNLNGKTLYNTDIQTITNNGKLTLTGDGKVIGNYKYTVVNNGIIEKYGNAELEYTGPDNYVIRNSGIANLYEGTIRSSVIGIENKENAKVLIDGITIEAEKFGIRNYSIYNSVEEPAVTILSGEIISNTANTICNESEGLINIAGGKIVSKDEITGITVSNGANGIIYISGGEIFSDNRHGVWNRNEGLIHIVGGTIKAEVYAIHMEKAEGTLIIGTNEENPQVSITSPIIIGHSSGVHNRINATVKFYDGIIMGETDRSILGDIADIPDGYYIEKGTETIDGTTYETSYLAATQSSSVMSLRPTTDDTIKENTTINNTTTQNNTQNELTNNEQEQTNPTEELETEQTNTNETQNNPEQSNNEQPANIIQISDNYYTTIQEAINAANSGDTLKLLDNITLTEEVIITKDKNIKLDLNGKTLTSTNVNTITNNGTLALTGAGIIRNEVENGNVIYNTGILNIQNGVITTATNGGKAIYNDAGTINMSAGKIVTEGISGIGIYNVNKGKVAMKSGIIETTGTSSKCIYNDASLEITGGNIVVSGDDSIGIYNSDKATSCTMKNVEILVEAEVIENYELIKNTTEFKAELEQMKPSYGVYNNSKINVEIETATIKVERLKGVGILNKLDGSVTLGVEDSEVSVALPIIYAISDNTTAIVNSGNGHINFFDGRLSTLSSIKDVISKVLENYEIVEEIGESIVNTTLKLIDGDKGDGSKNR